MVTGDVGGTWTLGGMIEIVGGMLDISIADGYEVVYTVEPPATDCHPICQTFQFPPKSFGAIQILLLEWSCWMEWKNCLLGHWRLKSWKAAATGRLWIIRIK